MPFWRRGRDRAADAGPRDGGAETTDRAPSTGHAESAELERAMRRVAEQDTLEHRRVLFQLLLAATLFAAAADPFVPGEQAGLTTVVGEHGPVLPVFTRTDALLAWRPTGYRPVALLGRTLFETAERDRIARIEVNPGSVPRGWISRTEIEGLAQGRLLGPREELAPPTDDVRVGPPAVRPPDALVEAARRALEGQTRAVAGWLFATQPGDGPAQLMVGVQLARGLDQAATDETMQAIVEETWARSSDADRLRFTVVARRELYDTLRGGAGELIFKR